MSYTKIIPNWVDCSREFKYSWSASAPVFQQVGGFTTLATLSIPTTKTGSKVDGWRKKIRDGANATSGYSRSGSFLVSSEPGEAVFTGSFKHQTSVYPAAYSEGYLPTKETVKGFASPMVIPGHLAVSSDKANAAALTETYKKVLKAQRQLNGSAVVAEFAETLHMFGRPFKSVVDLTHRHLNRLTKERRRLKGPTARKKEDWADIVSSTYLEYAFGLAPLINDTKAVAEALARWNLEGQEEILAPKKKAVGRGSDKSSSSTIRAFGFDVPSRYLAFLEVKKKTTEARAQYVVGLSATLQADFQSNERLIQLLGFSPSDWLPGLYEGVPWSWLLDYFTNVGDVLEAACTSTADVKWISKTLSTRTEEETSINCDTSKLKVYASQGCLGPTYRGHGGRFKIVTQSMVRTSEPSLGIPPLVLEFPSRATQFINMAAVLIQRKKAITSLWKF